jgi:uncharacterized protein (DUF885 family)
VTDPTGSGPAGGRTDSSGTDSSGTVARFEAFARDAVDDLLRHQPAMATELGDHRFDDRLEDLRPAAIEEERRALAARLVELDSFDQAAPAGVALPEPYRVDADVLGVRLRQRLFELGDSRAHTWNPLIANPGSALYVLLARDFAPPRDRLVSVTGRLTQVPEQLAAARASLSEMPRIHVETAIDQFSGTLRLLTEELPRQLEGVPDLVATASPAIDAAAAAVQEHLGWLQDRLETSALSPRLGRDMFARRLALVLDTELSPEQLLSRAMDDLVEIEAELAVVSADLGGEPRGVLARLGDDAPDDDTIVGLARDALAETTQFVRERELATIFDDPVEIIVMPEIHRGVAVAYCDAPGPLDPPDSTTFFAISPTPADWPPERVRSFYREYNVHMVRNLVIHEAMPGHVLQLAHGRRAPLTTKVRQAFTNSPFVEGWAEYAEALMVEAGFGGAAVRMQQLKMRLRTAINTVLDVRIHCDELSRDDAMSMMLGRGFQEEGEATGKWRRALLTSAQLSTYHVGFLQVRDIATQLAAAEPGWSVRQRHDALLAHGSPPPRHLPRLLGLRPLGSP